MSYIQQRIKQLKRNNAVHVKRGYCINDISVELQSNHLLEEVVELQAEILANHHERNPNAEKIVKEACHVYACFIHLMVRLGIDFRQLEEVTDEMLSANWTTNPEEVTAKEPGFTRAGRADSHGGSASPGEKVTQVLFKPPYADYKQEVQKQQYEAEMERVKKQIEKRTVSNKAMEITAEMAHIILGALSVCESESMSGLVKDAMPIEQKHAHEIQLVQTIKDLFPEIAEQYSGLWLFKYCD